MLETGTKQHKLFSRKVMGNEECFRIDDTIKLKLTHEEKTEWTKTLLSCRQRCENGVFSVFDTISFHKKHNDSNPRNPQHQLLWPDDILVEWKVLTNCNTFKWL